MKAFTCISERVDERERERGREREREKVTESDVEIVDLEEEAVRFWPSVDIQRRGFFSFRT
jgi:hypothetical protein